MHIYIDTRTSEPVLIRGSHLPLLRPLENNRRNETLAEIESTMGGRFMVSMLRTAGTPPADLERRANESLSGIKDAEKTGRLTGWGYTQAQISDNPERKAAEELLAQGIYVDSDFKHTCYLKAREVASANGSNSEETNKIALVFGLPAREQVLAYILKYRVLIAKIEAVVKDPRMTGELAKHNIHYEGFESVLQEVLKKGAEAKEQKDRKEGEDLEGTRERKEPDLSAIFNEVATQLDNALRFTPSEGEASVAVVVHTNVDNPSLANLAGVPAPAPLNAGGVAPVVDTVLPKAG